jgi:TRIAD3 protein (E3 ubiquitin-protein ligase RNF216)
LEREQQEIELMEELKAARLARRHANLMRQKELEALEAEKRNFDEALSKGEIKECECCFVDTAQNRLVHCNAENTHVSTPNLVLEPSTTA